MKFLPVKTAQSEISAADKKVERNDPIGSLNPFFSFTYSHHEMHISSDEQTQFKSRKVQLKDGRIDSETFEGLLPAAIFEKALHDSQRLFADQAVSLLKQFPFFPLLPGAGTRDDDTK